LLFGGADARHCPGVRGTANRATITILRDLEYCVGDRNHSFACEFQLAHYPNPCGKARRRGDGKHRSHRQGARRTGITASAGRTALASAACPWTATAAPAARRSPSRARSRKPSRSAALRRPCRPRRKPGSKRLWEERGATNRAGPPDAATKPNAPVRHILGGGPDGPAGWPKRKRADCPNSAHPRGVGTPGKSSPKFGCFETSDRSTAKCWLRWQMHCVRFPRSNGSCQ